MSSQEVLQLVKELSILLKLELMVSGFELYIFNALKFILKRCGIGNGSICITRVVAGAGVP
jgi:hypothetical protein